jgi:hypothetical protein
VHRSITNDALHYRSAHPTKVMKKQKMGGAAKKGYGSIFNVKSDGQ